LDLSEAILVGGDVVDGVGGDCACVDLHRARFNAVGYVVMPAWSGVSRKLEGRYPHGAGRERQHWVAIDFCHHILNDGDA